MKTKFFVALFASLLVPLCALAQVPKDENQPASLNHLMNVVNDLGSDDFVGRMAGTEGYDKSAEYVINELAQYGVQPYQGNWNQLFEIETNEIWNATFRTYLNAQDERTVLVLGRDFCCTGMTGRGYADANVVFCGYGIDDPKFDEYKKVDAQGKIVMILNGAPNFVSKDIARKFTIREKTRAAMRHGACGLVIVNIGKNAPIAEVQGNIFNGEGPHLATFPVLFATQACAEQLLDGEPLSFQEAVDTIQHTFKPFSFHMRKRFEMRVDTKYHPSAITENIIGIYPGSDSRMSNEYIVVGANLDGIGQQGETCLFPGASENASGVAVLLEVARMLHNAALQPRRSVIFVLFSGSEQQHIGSQIFVSNFKPLNRIEAFIGIENVAMGDSIVAMGNGCYPSLYQVACNMDSAFTDHFLARQFDKLPCSAEALAFDKVKIPSLLFTNMNGGKYHHVPSDIPENVDRQFILRTAKLVYETVYELTFGDYQGRSIRSKRIRFE